MRPIKFRGMDSNGIMRYGRLSQSKPGSTIYYDEYSQSILWDDSGIPVSNKTLGQFTGLHDKNEKEIYEDDLYKDIDDNIFHICWGEQTFKFFAVRIRRPTLMIGLDSLKPGEVLGNIYEHPELLK